MNYMEFINTELFINIAIAFAIILFSKIISSFIAYILIKMVHFKIKDKEKIKQSAFYKPIKTFVVILGLYCSTLLFDIPENIKLIIAKTFKICIILLVSKGFANVFNTSSESFNKIKRKLHFKGSDSLFNFLSKFSKIIIYIIAGFIIISEFGYDLSGLVTGLGISSVVIALAAQDIAKSMLGGFCIFLDKPFSIGDYVSINGLEGTIEDITFRTTRIRNASKDVIVIPNSEIAGASIINSSKKESKLYELLLTFDVNTPSAKVTDIKGKIASLLASNDHILENTIKVFFDAISTNGINMKVIFYTDIIDSTEFINFKEAINFSILELVQKSDIELAHDSRTVYVKR